MKTVLITGASAGIGKAMAYKFASEGFNLILVARREDALQELKKDIEAKNSVKVQIEVCNLGISGNAVKLYEKLKSQNIDVLINNAGFGDLGFPWDVNLSKAKDMIDLNIKALTQLSLLYVKDYADKNSTLINVSSIAGYSQIDISVLYCATKFYVSSFTEGLDLALRTQGKKLRAKILAPGPTETEFIEQASKNAGIQTNNEGISSSMATAEDLANYTYELYKSDKVLGIVDPKDNRFELRDAIFPQVNFK